jgi:hypothetical protein
MKRIQLASLLAAGLLAGTASPLAIAGDDLCRNVGFKFKNQHTSGREIQVVKVTYQNVVNDRQVTVNVPNTVCAYGAVCTTPGVDLKDVEGNNIKDITYTYKEKDRQGNWMEPWTRGSGPFSDANKECRANRTYGGAAFAITGTFTPTASQPNPNTIGSATAVR